MPSSDTAAASPTPSSSSLPVSIASTAAAPSSSPSYDVIIVGAGPAGIAAARRVLEQRPSASVLLLEGRQRIGGRTLTSHALGVPVDLGASWIHHFSPSNPIVPLAMQTLRSQLAMTDDQYLTLVKGQSQTAASPAASAAPPAAAAAAVKAAELQAAGESEVPVMATACYCGFVVSVDAEGRSVSLPPPFPGLGGGEGDFILFDSDGSRVPHALYAEAVRLYNQLMRQAAEHGSRLQAELPPPPHPSFPSSPPLTLTELAANYQHCCDAVAAVDTSVLSFLSPSLSSLPPALRRCVDFLLSGAEQFEGASLSALSALYWQAGSEGSGEVDCDMLVQRGYGELVRELGQALPVRTGRVVTGIDYAGQQGVTVAVQVEEGPEGREKPAGSERYQARAVIVTAPLGCLKRGSISFSPPLPAAKTHAIAAFGFGLMNKIVLQFDECWWGESVISIGWCGKRRGQYRWLLSLRQALQLSSGVLQQHASHRYKDGLGGSGNVLVCFSTADPGWEAEETRSDEQQKDDVMAVLRSAFTRADINAAAASGSSPLPQPPSPSSSSLLTPDTVVGTSHELLYTGALPCLTAVPEPSAYLVTRWGSDRFCYGSYSHYALGSNELTVRMLAAAVGDGRVGFAGEHTSSSSIGCVDSAWETGVREADRVLTLLQQQQTA